MAVALLACFSSPAQADKVRITALSDVNFGTVANLQVDNKLSQNVCVYSNGPTNGYNVTATGSGTGSAFLLANGANTMAYQVQWRAQSGQTSGTNLTSGTALTGLTSVATQQSCNAGPSTSASLIIILPATSLSQARAGNYSGSLTLLIGAE